MYVTMISGAIMGFTSEANVAMVVDVTMISHVIMV